MFSKIKIQLSDEERSVLIKTLIEYKNILHERGKYTDAVDELIIKIIG